MPKDLYWNCTRGAGASGLHMVKGWRKIGGMGSGTVPDAVMWLTIGKFPIQSVMVCRALSKLSAISSCVACASHGASACRIVPPAIFPHRRGFRQYVSKSVTGHFRPWPVPLCDRPGNT